ncbi:hypothetical protein MTP99_017777 [Tenebrio molitor]|nr:hypothetical protein MTP99_017777 [Tenebrio molitor]
MWRQRQFSPRHDLLAVVLLEIFFPYENVLSVAGGGFVFIFRFVGAACCEHLSLVGASGVDTALRRFAPPPPPPRITTPPTPPLHGHLRPRYEPEQPRYHSTDSTGMMEGRKLGQ